MIYGVSDCPWCLRAQALCMDKGANYAWVMMDWSKQYREYIKSSWKWKTYPIITKMNFDEDEKIKELAETKNKADSLIFQTERQLKEYGDKIPAEKKGQEDVDAIGEQVQE